MKQSRWAPLLEEYPDLRRWYDNLARGSENTARERMRVLYRFLIKLNYTPTTLVEEAQKDQKKIENLLLDFVTELSKEKMSPGYIENYLKSVRAWLSFNGIELKQRIKIGNRNEQPTIADERVPMKEELRQILLAADARGRTSIALMSMSGLRPQVLGDMQGLEGLKLGDRPELEVRGGQDSFKSIPTMIVVRASVSKAR
ncbi:MAG: site-specific integrase, partial [Candidatus Bathyarchaeota archaeon]|nr:site-specific integrase [Candidatus Bathyarchaeota archaeon]